MTSIRFNIKLGIPEVENLWNNLNDRRASKRITKTEKSLHNKLGKTFNYLSIDPRVPSLNTHEIKELSKLYGIKIWQSYLENNTPSAGRIFWTYGPDKNDITILAIEPHPEDSKRGSYKRIKLSSLPHDPYDIK